MIITLVFEKTPFFSPKIVKNNRNEADLSRNYKFVKKSHKMRPNQLSAKIMHKLNRGKK
jgi:hypothetical protein